MKCIYCQNEIPDDTKYCPFCGTPQPKAPETDTNTENEVTSDIPAANDAMDVAPASDIPEPIADIPDPVVDIPDPVTDIPDPVADIPDPVSSGAAPTPDRMDPLSGEPQADPFAANAVPPVSGPQPNTYSSTYSTTMDEQPKKKKGPLIAGIIAAVVVFAVVLAVFGMNPFKGEAEKKAVFTSTDSMNQAEYTMSIYYSGDKITKIEQTCYLPLDGYSDEQIDSIKEYVEQVEELCDEDDFMQYSCEFSDDSANELFVFRDLDKKENLSALAETGLMKIDGTNVDYLSFKDTEKNLLEIGFTRTE